MYNRHHHDGHKGGPRHLCIKILNTVSEEIREWEVYLKGAFVKEAIYYSQGNIWNIRPKACRPWSISTFNGIRQKRVLLSNSASKAYEFFCWESKPGI